MLRKSFLFLVVLVLGTMAAFAAEDFFTIKVSIDNAEIDVVLVTAGIEDADQTWEVLLTRVNGVTDEMIYNAGSGDWVKVGNPGAAAHTALNVHTVVDSTNDLYTNIAIGASAVDNPAGAVGNPSAEPANYTAFTITGALTDLSTTLAQNDTINQFFQLTGNGSFGGTSADEFYYKIVYIATA